MIECIDVRAWTLQFPFRVENLQIETAILPLKFAFAPKGLAQNRTGADFLHLSRRHDCSFLEQQDVLYEGWNFLNVMRHENHRRAIGLLSKPGKVLKKM